MWGTGWVTHRGIIDQRAARGFIEAPPAGTVKVVQGAIGMPGAPGPVGPQGAVGKIGPQGAMGPPGLDASVEIAKLENPEAWIIDTPGAKGQSFTVMGKAELTPGNIAKLEVLGTGAGPEQTLFGGAADPTRLPFARNALKPSSDNLDSAIAFFNPSAPFPQAHGQYKSNSHRIKPVETSVRFNLLDADYWTANTTPIPFRVRIQSAQPDLRGVHQALVETEWTHPRPEKPGAIRWGEDGQGFFIEWLWVERDDWNWGSVKVNVNVKFQNERTSPVNLHDDLEIPGWDLEDLIQPHGWFRLHIPEIWRDSTDLLIYTASVQTVSRRTGLADEPISITFGIQPADLKNTSLILEMLHRQFGDRDRESIVPQDEYEERTAIKVDQGSPDLAFTIPGTDYIINAAGIAAWTANELVKSWEHQLASIHELTTGEDDEEVGSL